MTARTAAILTVLYVVAVVCAANEIAQRAFPESYMAQASFVLTVAYGAGGAFGRYLARYRNRQ